jgi:hypothetical protein
MRDFQRERLCQRGGIGNWSIRECISLETTAAA